MIEHQNTDISSEWLAEFEAAAKRSLKIRVRHSFIHTYKPVRNEGRTLNESTKHNAPT